MPLYTTPMVWDSDINPEGAFEKFKYTSDNVDLFVDFGQFDYQDPNEAIEVPSSDTFLLTWQAGANVESARTCPSRLRPYFILIPASAAPTAAAANGLNKPYTGQGSDGVNVNYPGGLGLQPKRHQ